MVLYKDSQLTLYCEIFIETNSAGRFNIAIIIALTHKSLQYMESRNTETQKMT